MTYLGWCLTCRERLGTVVIAIFKFSTHSTYCGFFYPVGHLSVFAGEGVAGQIPGPFSRTCTTWTAVSSRAMPDQRGAGRADPHSPVIQCGLQQVAPLPAQLLHWTTRVHRPAQRGPIENI